MKTVILVLISCSTMLAQQKPEITSWLVNPAYVKNSVYVVNAGRNPYEALLRSLSGLAEKLSMSASESQPEGSMSALTVPTYSFGAVHITYQKKSSRASSENGDSLQYQSTVTFSVKIQFSDTMRKCFIKTSSSIIDRADDETFNPSSYNSQTNSDQSLSYEFTNMTFSDLLAELEHEGVKIHFTTEYDVTYLLATYPLSKVKK